MTDNFENSQAAGIDSPYSSDQPAPAPAPAPSPADQGPIGSPDQGQGGAPPIESFIPQGGSSGGSAPEMGGEMPKPQMPKMPSLGGEFPIAQIAIGIIVVIALLGGGYYFLTHSSVPTSSSTTTKASIPTTTVQQINVQNIMQCTNITQPGTYTLTGNITTQISSGPCINVESGNVRLIGNGNGVNGNGPFIGLPPFTYAILLNHVSNVTVSGFSITSFSYGIYSNGSTNSTISNNTLSKITLSGIFLKNSFRESVLRNTISQVTSKQGAINLARGGNNLVLNNTLDNNAYYGLIINSTNNTFNKDNFAGNPTDILCNASAGFRNLNTFTGSNCATNQFCNFAWCSHTNTPANLSSISLSGNSIKSCGGINAPGTYVLGSNLDMRSYINTSNPAAASSACISINSANVRFNCNGRSITNSPVGISGVGQVNFTIMNCNLFNDTYGIYTNSSFNYAVNSVSITNSLYGLFTDGSTKGNIRNTTITNSTYANYVGNSAGLLFNNLRALNNTYGSYMAAGGGNAYSGGRLTNNVKADLYCTSQTYNQTTDLLQGTLCGTTNCEWGGSCAQLEPPPLKLYPVSKCGTLKNPGNYTLTTSINNAAPNCIDVTGKHITLYCNGHTMSGTLQGSAIFIANDSNVTVTGCRVVKYPTAANVSNSAYVTISNFTTLNATNAVSAKNVSASTFSNIHVSFYTGSTAFMFNQTFNSVIQNNNVFDALANGADGYVFRNVHNTLITGNNVTQDTAYGMFFNNSRNNTVFNNIAAASSLSDYACTPDSSGIYQQKDGINTGTTKSGCAWLVEQNPLAPSQLCYGIHSPQFISLAYDFIYPYGSTCFSVYNSANSLANGTTIDCNGHTVLATNGGTFVSSTNTSDVIVENCYLKNFTTALVSYAPQFQVINNTIANSNTSILLTNSHYSGIFRNTILNSSSGIVMQNTNYAQVQNNSLANVNLGIELVGGTGNKVYNDRAILGQIGMYLINNTVNFFQNDVLTQQSRYGVTCTLDAIGKNSLNFDNGGNICSSNYQCRWMTNSPQCAPS